MIFIGPKAQAVILPYLTRDAMPIFQPGGIGSGHGKAREAARKTPLHLGNRAGTNRKRRPLRTAKGHYTKDSYARAIRRGIDKANAFHAEQAAEFDIPKPATLTYWAPNRLRHTCGTEVRKIYGLEAAQVILGHAKADVTQVYAERDAARAVEVMKNIG